MALLGPLPDFVRISIRLTATPDAPFHERGARAAAALLARLSRTVGGHGGVDSTLWRRAYAVVGLPESTVPPHEALGAWAASPGGVPSVGVVEDVVNAFSLESGAPSAAYDIGAVAGDLWLRPSRGIEVFESADGRTTAPEINEIILVDSQDRVAARAWHGAQSAPSRVRPGAGDILVHADLLGVELDAAGALAEALAARLTGFAGGRARAALIHRDAPMASWTE